MDLNDLKVFLDVYRAGGFAPVAHAANLSPSAISRTIARLEKSLGVRLFQRSTRSLAPTEAGEQLFARLDTLLEDMTSAFAAVQDLAVTPSGTLRVGCSTGFGQFVIAPNLTAFFKEYPDLSVSLVTSDSQDDLLEGRIDLAVRHGPLVDSSLISRSLMTVKYYLVASEAYLEENGIPSSPDDLKDHRLVTFDLGPFREAWRFQCGDADVLVPVSASFSVNSASALLEYASAGGGIALLADWTIRRAINNGRVKRILQDWDFVLPHGPARVSMVYPSRRFIPLKVRVFQEFLVEICSQHDQTPVR